ncbi:MAG: PLP-dependent aspartate aminotransferase family protein [Thermoanaerobaculum sp.]|nr:PLP-dependent aspartate aminotransferase family protein [Thermoanaerobaculum sp.]
MAQQSGPYTKMVHAGQEPDWTGAVTVPIYQTSTFAFPNAEIGAARFAGQDKGFIYTRLNNPTLQALEECVAALEHGSCAVATASGMGAVSTVYLTLLGQGLHMVGTASCYGPSRVLTEKYLARFGVEASFVDTSDLDQVARALRPNTRLIYVESPSNPAMIVTDLAAVADLAHHNGALLAVDNTFASPYLQQPLNLGADLSLHSVSKFLNGHADVIGGIVITRDPALGAQLRSTMAMLGCNMDPHQAFLVLRGIKTLGLRVERAQANAMAIAQFLENHPKVARVFYVGLPSHPQYQLAKKQMAGPGCVLSFELKGGLEAARKLLNSVRLATLAVSLGGVETLIEHPATMTHASLPREERLAAGITDGLIRLAVGIEDLEDLLADLDQALARV